MLARDWYYNERNRMGIEPAVASIYDAHDDADLQLAEALEMPAHGQQRAEQSGADQQRADAEQERGDGADL